MEYFYKIKRENNKYNISKKNDTYMNSKIPNEYNNVMKKILTNTDKDIKYISNNINKIYVKNQFYLWQLLDFDINNSYNILSKDFDKDFYITKVTNNGANTKYIGTVEEIKDKYQNILYNMVSSSLYMKIKDYDLCEREAMIFNNKLIIISYLYNFLEKGGNFFLSTMGFCNDRTIEIFYILSYMFDDCIIYNSTFILCKNFNPVLKKSVFEQIINKDNPPLHNRLSAKNSDSLNLHFSAEFSFEPKHDLENLLNYLETNLKYQINKFNILLDKNEDLFLDFVLNDLVSTFKYYNKNILDQFLIDFNKSIIEAFKRVYVKNKTIKFSSAIQGKEGKFIYDLLNKHDLNNCLEIGMAYGISSFYILSVKNTKLISIDPYQKEQWSNNGINLIKEFNFQKRHKLMEIKSYMALPKLLEKNQNKFDFIFIDDFHTFDYTLLDFFYSNLLLKINGYILIDDALHYGVNKCIEYIKNNYSNFYKKIESPITFALFKKINEDKREWNFHKNF
jgi:predicted O-methyltransferase YrrM